MSKDKKKKKDDKKKRAVTAAPAKASKKVGKSLKAASQNPLVADVIAAALVATAAALKDSNKARQLAASAGDELDQLAKASGERGNAMWQLALDIGRRAVEELSKNGSAPKQSAAK